MCPGGNPVDVLISLFQFISRPHPATLTLKSIPSFMVHHLQSILPSSHLHDGLPHTGHMFAGIHRSFLVFSRPGSAVQRELTRLWTRRRPAAHLPPALTPSSFHHPAGVTTGRSAALIHGKRSSAPTAKPQTATRNKCKWPLEPSGAPLCFTSWAPFWNFRRTY